MEQFVWAPAAAGKSTLVEMCSSPYVVDGDHVVSSITSWPGSNAQPDEWRAAHQRHFAHLERFAKRYRTSVILFNGNFFVASDWVKRRTVVWIPDFSVHLRNVRKRAREGLRSYGISKEHVVENVRSILEFAMEYHTPVLTTDEVWRKARYHAKRGSEL
jgi:hypothetical protein